MTPGWSGKVQIAPGSWSGRRVDGRPPNRHPGRERAPQSFFSCAPDASPGAWLDRRARADMDVVRGSGLRVVPWIPLIDAHGIDRAYSLDGIGQPSLVQVKTCASLDEAGRYHWT